MPVGTRGAIKYLSAADYERLGAEIVLGNTYHLMLRPGAETVAALGGLGRVRRMGRADAYRLRRLPGVLARPQGRRRRRHVPQHLRRLDAPLHPRDRGRHAGAARRRHPDGARRLPAAAVAARRHPARRRAHRGVGGAGREPHIGARIRRCSASSRVGSTKRCAPRARSAPSRSTSTATASAASASGETRGEMLPALAAALAHLPADRPRYLMGVGDPASLVEAVALGVDQFDCVLQTRLGRHGTALTGSGKLHVKNAEHATQRRAARRRLRLRGLRPAQPRLPPPPVPGRRADGVAAAQPAQRQLDAAADGTDAGGDRGRNVSTDFAGEVLAVWG